MWRGDRSIGDPAFDRFLDYCGYYGGRSGIVGHLLTSRGGCRIVSATSSEAKDWSRAEIATVLTLANLIVLRERQIRTGLGEALPVSSLSPVQTEILKWAAQGKSNTDIATILATSRRAVAYHFGQILEKLGVASRSQAIAVMVSRDEGF